MFIVIQMIAFHLFSSSGMQFVFLHFKSKELKFRKDKRAREFMPIVLSPCTEEMKEGGSGFKAMASSDPTERGEERRRKRRKGKKEEGKREVEGGREDARERDGRKERRRKKSKGIKPG